MDKKRSLNRLFVLPVCTSLVLLAQGLICQPSLAAPRDVQFKSVNFETLVIEVHNFGAAAEPFTNWRFCSHDDNQVRLYSTPGALNAITLGAGESFFLHFNNDAPGGASDAFNISSLGGFATPLDRGPFSINLYLNSAFTQPSSMVDHVQWNIDGVDDFFADERSLVAQNAGLWTNEAQWVPTSATTQRLELNLDGLGNPPAGTHGPTSYSAIEPPQLSPADFDGDTDVDGDDLAFWTASFGANSGGDIDADGDTDGDDFLIWQQEFTGPGGLRAVAAVPEPTSTGLVVLGTILLGTMRRRLT